MIKKFFQGKFVRGVASVLAGNVGAQAVSFLAAPIITRLYSPDEFGVMMIVWSCSGILMVASCLSYDQAVIIEEKRENSLNLLGLCILVTISISLLIFGILVFNVEKIAQLINFHFDNRYLLLVPAVIFASGLHKALTAFSIRGKKYKLLATCSIFGAFSAATFKIIPALFLFSSGQLLILGNMLSLLVPAIVLLTVSVYGNVEFIKRVVSWRKVVNLAKKYARFPTYQVPTNLLNSASQNLPVVLLAYFYSPQVIGHYGLAISMTRRPLSLVTQSLSSVLLQKLAEDNVAPDSLKNTFIKTTKWLVCIGCVPFALLTFWGQEVFSIVFGNSWAEAGRFAQILSPWLFVGFILPPSIQVVIVKQKLKFNMIYNFVLLVARCLAVVVFSSLSYGPMSTVAAFSSVGIIFNIFYVFSAYQLVSVDK